MGNENARATFVAAILCAACGQLIGVGIQRYICATYDCPSASPVRLHFAPDSPERVDNTENSSKSSSDMSQSDVHRTIGGKDAEKGYCRCSPLLVSRVTGVILHIYRRDWIIGSELKPKSNGLATSRQAAAQPLCASLAPWLCGDQPGKKV